MKDLKKKSVNNELSNNPVISNNYSYGYISTFDGNIGLIKLEGKNATFLFKKEDLKEDINQGSRIVFNKCYHYNSQNQLILSAKNIKKLNNKI
ncbi:hypothetical protein CPAV1605_605 [seawater metagenome]|uniref:Uncharacterized protein n=1 Tax=seawater metagenome TaxID=1561972 RepID=A0A5E8CM59_9ZZZZ